MTPQKKISLRGSLAVLALSALLAACGGGGGSPGTTGSAAIGSGSGTGTGTATPVSAGTIAVSFVNAAGTATNAVTSASPLTVKALVKDSAGKIVVNQLVSFATDNTLAVFSPSSGTVLTDATGTASVTLTPASLSANSSGTVTASTTLSGATSAIQSTGNAGNYTVGATALTLSPITLSQPHIAAYNSTDVSVTVQSNGVAYTAQSLNVSFSSACITSGKASLATTVPTSSGVAKAVYRDLGCGGNDTITATVAGAAKSASATVQIDAPAAASIKFTVADPVNQSIVIKGQGGINRTETATLTFQAIDIFSKPLANVPVTFSVDSTNVTLNKTSDTTDASGNVVTTVNSGSVPTSFSVKATLAGGVSTQSSTIIVTTGQPVQRAFSLGVSNPNIEGWNVDSGTTTPASIVSVLMADQNGNPVSDGTPVVFQTNLGSVGSSSKGGCNSVNGGCSVDYRSQEPRTAANNLPSTPCNTGTAAGVSNDSTRPGVATICGSTTDGTNTVFAKTALFLSGNTAANVFLNGGTTRLTSDPLNPTDLGTVGATANKVFSLQINDVNLNPMPSGTSVTVTNLFNAALVGAVMPATVQGIFPHSLSGDDKTGNVISGNQGSTHTITIGTTQPTPCVQPLVGTFNVVVTTPLATSTTYPFKLTFSCP
jgi:hypothetical protein